MLNALEKHAHVRLLPSTTTLLQLKEAGFDLILTGWGSCAIEASFLGIPVVAYTRFSSAEPFGIIHTAQGRSLLRSFLSDRSRWTLRASRDQVVDAYAATESMRFFDWSEIDFIRMDNILGKSGGYTEGFYKYWDSTINSRRVFSVSQRIRRYLDSRSRWMTLDHL